MSTARTLVMDTETMNLKIRRIAWELYEKHVDESEIIVAGISKSGYKVAERIVEVMKGISKLNITLAEMSINKKSPISGPTTLSVSPEVYRDKCVVIVDDVLNSGAVLIYAVYHFLDTPTKKMTTAVLVDRSHKRYPVKADVKGISLSTSLQEHVVVDLDGEVQGVYLE